MTLPAVGLSMSMATRLHILFLRQPERCTAKGTLAVGHCCSKSTGPHLLGQKPTFMANEHHDLFLVYGDTQTKSALPLIVVVGREPNNSHPFSSTVGNYPLEAQIWADGKKMICAFWDQA